VSRDKNDVVQSGVVGEKRKFAETNGRGSSSSSEPPDVKRN
jgi:hypothetical protein